MTKRDKLTLFGFSIFGIALAILIFFLYILFYNGINKNPHLIPAVGPIHSKSGTTQYPTFTFQLNTNHYVGACGPFLYKSGNTMYFNHCTLTKEFVLKYTNQPTPQPSPTPLPTPVPQPTQTDYGSMCNGGNANACTMGLLGLINKERASHGYQALMLNQVESSGTSSCVGAYGHAVHMAQAGAISHDQFPADICVSFSTAGENVGYAFGSEWDAIVTDFNQMISESWTPGCQDNHHCNIDYPNYNSVGIGIVDNGTTYVSEDFIG